MPAPRKKLEAITLGTSFQRYCDNCFYDKRSEALVVTGTVQPCAIDAS